MDKVQALEAVQAYLLERDHYDCKTIESDVTLREFIAGTFSYNPSWIRFLYRIRAVFVRLLGMHQPQMPEAHHFQPEIIAFEAGKHVTFFQVEAAEEDHYWIGSARDSHLSAYLVIAVEPMTSGQNRFHLATIVHYNNWAGPVYFNVIRPFHHLVVRAMMQAGANYPPRIKQREGLFNA